jgi:formate-dependent nitrite reductase membrane component NrfD
MTARDLPPGRGYEGPTYYDQPPVKASNYGALVWGYTWLAGLAGSAQVIATVADLLGRPAWQGLVRQGRALAAWLPPIGAGMLVKDLHTPSRFQNMLRIFRPTSPMSIGTYVLGAFSLSSIVTSLAAATGRRKVARVAQLPAAAAGAGMSVYTGALLGATSTALWSAEPTLLTGRFAASAFATGAAWLSIGETARGHGEGAAALQRVCAAAALVEHGFARAAEARWREQGLADTLEEPEIAAGRKASTQLGVWLPLACLVLNELAPRRSRTLTVVGAAGLLAGSLAMRATVFRAGNRSAQRPRDGFALTSAPAQARRRHRRVPGGGQP